MSYDIWALLTSYNIYMFLRVFKGVLGSLIMATSHLRIFMIFGILLFQDLKMADFLDPEFFDNNMWLQDPSKSACTYFYSS